MHYIHTYIHTYIYIYTDIYIHIDIHIDIDTLSCIGLGVSGWARLKKHPYLLWLCHEFTIKVAHIVHHRDRQGLKQSKKYICIKKDHKHSYTPEKCHMINNFTIMAKKQG